MPDVKVDKKMYGKWQKDDDSENYYLIEKLGKYQYQIVEHAFNPKDSTWEKGYYQAHITMVNEAPFLSIISQEVGASGEENLFYLYKMVPKNDSEFVLFPLSNYIREEFEDSRDLEAFIAQHMDLSFFYGDEETYSKVEMP